MTVEPSDNRKPDQPWLAYKRAMVIVAHPDDAEFGYGGTLAKLVKEGMELAYVICTNGNKGSSDPEMTSARLAVIREEEQRAASAAIGTRDVTFLGYGDGELEATREVIGKVVREIRRFKPDMVLCQNPYLRGRHNHRDHRMAEQTAFDAVYPYARHRLHYPEHQAEGLRPHAVAEIYTGGGDDPEVVIDVSDVVETRIEALKAHRSQIGNPEELTERIMGRTSELAEKHGYRYAEGFRRHILPISADHHILVGIDHAVLRER